MVVKLDEFGFPLDSRLRELQIRLGHLALAWRGAEGDVQRRNRIAQEYRQTLQYLYSVGWDGVLDFEAQLPDECMPEEFFRRNPEYRG